MADLAKLIVSLEAQTAKFQSDLDKANAKLDRFGNKTSAVVSGVKRAFVGLATAVAGGAFFKAVLNNSIESEEAISQLEARLKSTGSVAGFTSKQLQDFSTSLQKMTTFGDEAITGMQTLLLTFTNIRGEVFTGATRAILDMSVALKQDLSSSAAVVGKSLNDPIKGISALSRIGIQFTEQQKDQIKALVESGDVMKAQQVILDQLKVKFGGAAEAASNTFGGALKQLQNAFGDLLEVKGGVNDATSALKSFTAVLQDPAVITAAQSLFSNLIIGFAKVAETVAGLNILLTGKGGNEIVDLDLSREKLEKEMRGLESTLKQSRFTRISLREKFGFFPSDAEVKFEMLRVQDAIKANLSQQKKLLLGSGVKPGIDPKSLGFVPPPAGTGADDEDEDGSKTTKRAAAKEKLAKAEMSITEALEPQIAALERQVMLLGLTDKQAQIRELQLDGASVAQVQRAESAINAIDRQRAAEEKLTEQKQAFDNLQQNALGIIESNRTELEKLEAQMLMVNKAYEAGAVRSVVA